MNTRSRAILVIIATLVIGVLIGALLVGPQLARHHFDRMERLRTREGFASRMEGMIQPGPSQAGPIRTVLEKYGPRFEDINDQYHVAMKALADSLRGELDPLLTDEQRSRMHKMGPPPDHSPSPPPRN